MERMLSYARFFLPIMAGHIFPQIMDIIVPITQVIAVITMLKTSDDISNEGINLPDNRFNTVMIVPFNK